MNSKILPAAATAVFGFALGWLIKPAPAPADPSTAVVNSGANKGTSGGGGGNDASSHPLSLPTRGQKRPSDHTEIKRSTDVNLAWKDITNRAEAGRLERYSEALGLDADQEKQLADIHKKEHAGFKDLVRSGKSPSELLADAAAAESEANDALKQTLDPAQVSAMDAYKERQKDNSIESKAQSVLGDVISNADLSADQREQVLKLLRDNSAKEYANRPPGWDLISENYSILGTQNSGLIDNIGSVLTADGPSDPGAMQKRMIEAQRQTVQNRMSMLGGVLTPAQLTQYRTALEGRMNLNQSVPSIPSPATTNR